MSDHNKFMAAQHLSNGGLLEKFMPIDQRFTLKEQLKGKEGIAIAQAVLETVHRILATPLTYQTEAIHMPEKVVHLHYFRGGVDAWIVERDLGECPDPEHLLAGIGEQRQAFGKCDVFGGGWWDAEWGYVSIQFLIEAGVELDLHWEPKAVKEIY
ncbi:MAG: hypothetical protein IV103_20205 [Zoogloea sp.]|nr:hypothetical protein [Zoogloea sp.]